MIRPRLRRSKAPLDPIVVALQHASSIGNLEALAGIRATEMDRTQFWEPFSHLPGTAGLDGDVAELRRRIMAAGVTHRTVEYLRCLRAKAQTSSNTDVMKYWNGIVKIAEAQRTDLHHPQRRQQNVN